MLFSASLPPSQHLRGRGRSKSWGTDLHDAMMMRGSESAPSLSTVALISPHRPHARKAFAGGAAAAAAGPPNNNNHLLLHTGNQQHQLEHSHPHSAAHFSTNLVDVKEDRELKDGRDMPVPPPPPLSAQQETKKEPIPGAWKLHDTWQWYNELPWLAGMNYLPRTAVNFVEMFDESTFDPVVIEEELQWAADKLGYNTLRTNLPMVLYEHDAAGLTRRVNKFLRIAARCGFVVALVPLDDCEFSGRDPVAGPQPEPVPNLHNSQAVGSPGRSITRDPSQWFRVEEYIRYVVRTWGQDPRVFLLDLYNEPANPWVFTPDGTIVVDDVEQYEECALRLLEKVFEWAREENPRQPLTISAWHMPDPFFYGADSIVPLSHPIDKRAMELSDVISVHAYCDLLILQATLREITHHGKPILLTEWMARQVQSTYETALPTLKELKVGAYQWGLVKGKTQTHLPWPHVANQFNGDPVWWHDVLDADGTFHNEQEGEVIRSFVYPQNKALSSDMFLLDVDSTESMERLVQASEESMQALLENQHQQHLSQNELSGVSSHHHLSHHTLSAHQLEGASHAELPSINEGELQVMPSVCSISMATINASAAAQAGENALALELELAAAAQPTHAKSTPTFATHMATPSMEGLDLAEVGGIEF